MEYDDQMASRTKYDCLMFDLDDTLYPYSSGIAVHCSGNIQEYMVQKLGIDESKVKDLCYQLYNYYGTTMAGLKAVGYHFDNDDYHRFVHGRLPYELLKPDPVLRSLLHSLPYRKIVFTNSDKTHAATCLKRLGLEDCFDEIIHFETLNPTQKGDRASSNEISVSCSGETAAPSTVSESEIFDIIKFAGESSSDLTLPKTTIVCKPFEEAFEQVFRIAKINPKRTLFFDDSVRNVLTAKQVGLGTVLVGKCERPKGADYAVESIHNIKEAIPELVEDEEQSENAKYTQEIAIETPVRA